MRVNELSNQKGSYHGRTPLRMDRRSNAGEYVIYIYNIYNVRKGNPFIISIAKDFTNKDYSGWTV